MANTGARLKPEANREVAFGALTTSFVQMGATFTGPLRTIYIENMTDVVCYFGITNPDGTIVQGYKLAPNSFRLYDCKTNDGFFNTGQAISVKYDSSGAAPTSGYVNVETHFA